MRRALRWLRRQFFTIALAGLALLGSIALLLAAPPPAAFAEKPPAQVTVQQATHARGSEPTPQERARAKERAQQGRLLYLGSLLYQGVLIGGFLLLGGTRWLGRITARFGQRWVVALAAVLGIVTLGMTALTLPLDYYDGFIFEHKYGLSNQTTLQWLRDYGVSGLVGAAFGFPLAAMLYGLLRRAPRTWWLWLAGLSLPLAIFTMLIQPVFIAPLFNKFTPLQDQELRQEILTLAHRQGIPAHDVFQMDASRQSNAVNAYVVGFGPTHRIVLYDTLLKNFTHEEIDFIMAHEMGHYKLGHVQQGIFLSVLGALVGGFTLYLLSGGILRRYGGRLGFRELGNPASYPLLMALGMAVSLVATPLGNAFSRHIERQADQFAVTVYPHPDAGISAFHKLARINVSEEDPPRWVEVLLYTHPTLRERIAMLQQVQQRERE